jgi:hypothetical protein
VRLAVFAAVAMLLAACGGGSNLPSGSVVNSPGSGGSGNPTKLVSVKVTVSVARGNRQMRPDYVSVNTESLVIELTSVDGSGATGVSATTINTTAHSHGCKEGSDGLVCSATAQGSPGEDVFAVTTYSARNATGSVLSVGTVQAKIQGANGKVPISNALSLTLDGLIASLKLALAPNWGKYGHAMKASVTLTAFDATGAAIVGPSDYASPVALTIQGDSQSAFALKANGKSGASLSILKPTSDITLTYDGNPQASSPVTLQGSVDGPSIGSSANFSLRGKQPPPPVGTIYALNIGANDGKSATVTEYDGKANGNVAPKNVLHLSSTLYARGIVLDAGGNLYVGYFDSPSGWSPSSDLPDTGNEVAIYRHGASGNDGPMAVLNSDPQTGTTLYPSSMSFDPSGRLVTFGANTSEIPSPRGAVLTYAAGSKGRASPEDGFNFASPWIEYSVGGATGLAVDASNNFYVSGGLAVTFTVDYGLFVANAADIDNPQAPVARTVSWSDEQPNEPIRNVSLDENGEIFFGYADSTSCQAKVNVYAGGVKGSDQPLRVLTLDGVSAQGCQNNPFWQNFPTIDLYSRSLYVVDPINNALDAFPAGNGGTVKPTIHIAGSLTGLNAPVGLVVTSLSGSAAADPVTGASQRAPVRPTLH